VPLRGKFALFAVVLSALVAAQGAVSYGRERRSLVEGVEERALVLVRTLADAAREPIASSRYYLLDAQVMSILTERDAAYARILDDRGRIVADTRPGFVGWSISGSGQDAAPLSTEGDMLLARAPIVIPGRADCLAELALRLGPLRRKLADSRLVLFRFAVAELGACVAFLALLSFQVLGPVRALTRTLAAASPDGAPAPISLPGASGPEIRSIARAVDELRVRIAEYQAELVAEERLATIGKMAAEVAHEVRNPLEAISGATELLARDDGRDDGRDEYIGIIRQEVRLLDAYLSGILEFARTGAPGPEEADLAELVAETAALAGPMAKEAGIRVRVEHRDGPLPCSVDRSAVKRAIFNIAANAIEAGPPGSDIRLATDGDGATVRVRVSDDGPGLSAEARERAFEPYFTTKRTGTGLGLALVRRIAEAHGGRAYFEDGSPGATFVLELPRDSAAPAGYPEEAT